MKKLLTFAVAMMLASSASALSFNWGATKVAFDGTTLKNADVTGYIVYLSSGELDSSYTMNDSFTAASVGTVISTGTKTSAVGKSYGTATFDYGAYDNGAVFGMLLSYKADEKTYYNLSSTTYTLSGIADETSSLSDASFTFNYTSKSDSGTSISGGGGWVAVPEPSTAALALAGLALLLKRRRA